KDARKGELYVRLFLAKRVDGVILTKAPGRLSPDLRRAFREARVPIVLLARAVAGVAADLVEMDDRGAAREGVLHLNRLGYRRIGFIGGLRGASTSRPRLDGYPAPLRAARLPLGPALRVRGRFRVRARRRAAPRLP